MIDEEIEKLVCILLDVIVEFLLLFAQSGDELFGCNRADFLLLRGNAVEQVGQAGQQRLLGALVFRLVLEHTIAKWLAKVKRLQHGVAVASVAELCVYGRTKVVNDE